MYVCVPHACLWRSEGGIGAPGAVVTDVCELPCGCSEPLEEQLAFLTTEPSLQSLEYKSLTMSLSTNKAHSMASFTSIGALVC